MGFWQQNIAVLNIISGLIINRLFRNGRLFRCRGIRLRDDVNLRRFNIFSRMFIARLNGHHRLSRCSRCSFCRFDRVPGQQRRLLTCDWPVGHHTCVALIELHASCILTDSGIPGRTEAHIVSVSGKSQRAQQHLCKLIAGQLVIRAVSSITITQQNLPLYTPGDTGSRPSVCRHIVKRSFFTG